MKKMRARRNIQLGDRERLPPKPVEAQVIAGVPNDLLLPGAIVTLAVVIIGVFALARATSR